jgi:2-amino-4-hydroxy-6-hydroxymethyldihydropteridine diphosphokinase
MNNVYLLIGGNMGDRMAMLKSAADAVEKQCGNIRAYSSIYRTAAWGYTDQPDFYNQCLHLQTTLSAQALMKSLLGIETELGRVRTEKMGPRYIDIDILLFNDEIINEPQLEIPHPRLHLRRFALIPLAELAPEFVHPVLHKTIRQLLADCPDELDVHKI